MKGKVECEWALSVLAVLSQAIFHETQYALHRPISVMATWLTHLASLRPEIAFQGQMLHAF